MGKHGSVDDGSRVVFVDGAVQQAAQLAAPVSFGARPYRMETHTQQCVKVILRPVHANTFLLA